MARVLARVLGTFTVLLLLALSLPSDQARADDDDDDAAVLLRDPGPDWAPVLTLSPGDSVDNVFLAMGRASGSGEACPVDLADPLLRRPLPSPGSWACGRLVNAADTPGIWRIDFEETFGAGYLFQIRQGDRIRTVLSYPGSERADDAPLLTAGRRLASAPIVLQPQEAVDLFVQINAPDDLLDSDPVLRPEAEFDTLVGDRATGFGILLGAGALLCLFYVVFARLLGSRPAGHFAVYFTATILAIISNEGHFNAFLGADPTLAAGTLDKLFEAAQIGAHLAFIAAFLEEGLPGNRLSGALRRFSVAAVVVLLGALIDSYLLEGVQGLVAYHDLGYDLDPLLEDDAASLPMIVAALVTVLWLAALTGSAIYVLRRRTRGGTLFAIGAISLALAVLGQGLGDDLPTDFGDDNFAMQYVLLFDGIIFAAAMMLQAFGLRDERDAAIRQELALTQEKMRMAQSLLETRGDRDRALALAERHRNRLALTGHDLRQPLTSLRLAIEDAEKSSPSLGESLRSSLDFLKDVLESTVADTRPETIDAHHAVPEREAVPVQILFSNANRMFRDEAHAKGLELRVTPTDLSVISEAVPLIRILSNLLSNAIKYTQYGHVELCAEQEGSEIAIRIRDTGPGMNAAELRRIRQSYVRGSTAGDVEGDGLGLASAQELAEDLGLRLEITSTPGQGSCFSIAGMVPGAASDEAATS